MRVVNPPDGDDEVVGGELRSRLHCMPEARYLLQVGPGIRPPLIASTGPRGCMWVRYPAPGTVRRATEVWPPPRQGAGHPCGGPSEGCPGRLKNLGLTATENSTVVRTLAGDARWPAEKRGCQLHREDTGVVGGEVTKNGLVLQWKLVVPVLVVPVSTNLDSAIRGRFLHTLNWCEPHTR